MGAGGEKKTADNEKAAKAAGAKRKDNGAEAGKRNGNGAGEAAGDSTAPEISQEMREKIAALRSRVRESFGIATMAMMMLPRYRHQSLADLQHLVLEPLMQDRVAIAQPRSGEGEDGLTDVAGIAIWASVSEEVDEKIREQIRAGTFPVRLKPDEWNCGEINWLLDVIAPDRRTTTAVIANFRQLLKGGELRLHPIVSHLVDRETLEKMGARRMGEEEKDGAGSEEN